jgi:hypothetical protein
VLVGAAGESWNVSQAFQPDGRLAASNFPICFQVQVSLHIAHRKDVSNLRPNSQNARLESAEDRVLPAVVRDLLVRVSDKADENLLREKLGGAPIKVKINAARILRIGILEIVSKFGQPENSYPVAGLK